MLRITIPNIVLYLSSILYVFETRNWQTVELASLSSTFILTWICSGQVDQALETSSLCHMLAAYFINHKIGSENEIVDLLSIMLSAGFKHKF